MLFYAAMVFRRACALAGMSWGRRALFSRVAYEPYARPRRRERRATCALRDITSFSRADLRGNV